MRVPPAPKFFNLRENAAEIYTDTRIQRNPQTEKKILENAHSQIIIILEINQSIII